MRVLRLPYAAAEEMFRRLLLNVAARNQDDHTKNVGFLMAPDGQWRLAPAYDVTYAYNPRGVWTARHQLSVNGKREGIDRADLLAVARQMNIRKPANIIGEVVEAVRRWPEFAAAAGVTDDQTVKISRAHRLEV